MGFNIEFFYGYLFFIQNAKIYNVLIINDLSYLLKLNFKSKYFVLPFSTLMIQMEYKKKKTRINILKFNIICKKHTSCFFYLLLIFVGFQLFSCDESGKHEFITEGEIVYHIEYTEDGKNNSLISFLPVEMSTFFKMDASRTLIEGLFGTFKLSYILNYSEKQNYTLLQIMDKKYVYRTEIEDLAFGYNNKKTEIIYTDLKKRIAGYPCKHATVIFHDNPIDTVQVYYTNQIGLMHANYNNPFRAIEGVLMEFSVNLVNIKMSFKAKKVLKKKVDKEFLSVPPGFVNISEKQMKKLIDDFNGTKEQ